MKLSSPKAAQGGPNVDGSPDLIHICVPMVHASIFSSLVQEALIAAGYSDENVLLYSKIHFMGVTALRLQRTTSECDGDALSGFEYPSAPVGLVYRFFRPRVVLPGRRPGEMAPLRVSRFPRNPRQRRALSVLSRRGASVPKVLCREAYATLRAVLSECRSGKHGMMGHVAVPRSPELLRAISDHVVSFNETRYFDVAAIDAMDRRTPCAPACDCPLAPFVGATVRRIAAATCVQAAWRGHIARVRADPPAVVRLIQRRAILAIQRAWRSRLLRARMRLLSHVSRMVRALLSARELPLQVPLADRVLDHLATYLADPPPRPLREQNVRFFADNGVTGILSVPPPPYWLLPPMELTTLPSPLDLSRASSRNTAGAGAVSPSGEGEMGGGLDGLLGGDSDGRDGFGVTNGGDGDGMDGMGGAMLLVKSIHTRLPGEEPMLGLQGAETAPTKPKKERVPRARGHSAGREHLARDRLFPLWAGGEVLQETRGVSHERVLGEYADDPLRLLLTGQNLAALGVTSTVGRGGTTPRGRPGHMGTSSPTSASPSPSPMLNTWSPAVSPAPGKMSRGGGAGEGGGDGGGPQGDSYGAATGVGGATGRGVRRPVRVGNAVCLWNLYGNQVTLPWRIICTERREFVRRCVILYLATYDCKLGRGVELLSLDTLAPNVPESPPSRPQPPPRVATSGGAPTQSAFNASLLPATSLSPYSKLPLYAGRYEEVMPQKLPPPLSKGPAGSPVADAGMGLSSTGRMEVLDPSLSATLSKHVLHAATVRSLPTTPLRKSQGDKWAPAGATMRPHDNTAAADTMGMPSSKTGMMPPEPEPTKGSRDTDGGGVLGSIAAVGDAPPRERLIPSDVTATEKQRLADATKRQRRDADILRALKASLDEEEAKAAAGAVREAPFRLYPRVQVWLEKLEVARRADEAEADTVDEMHHFVMLNKLLLKDEVLRMRKGHVVALERTLAELAAARKHQVTQMNTKKYALKKQAEATRSKKAEMTFASTQTLRQMDRDRRPRVVQRAASGLAFAGSLNSLTRQLNRADKAVVKATQQEDNARFVDWQRGRHQKQMEHVRTVTTELRSGRTAERQVAKAVHESLVAEARDAEVGKKVMKRELRQEASMQQPGHKQTRRGTGGGGLLARLRGDQIP
eukprot:jgi/Mesvir1/2703/Mv05100-RA.1